MSEFVAVIMAGGTGQRFWPLSTADHPKQFLDLENTGRSMIQATCDRLEPITGGFDSIYVVTGERYAKLVRQHLPNLPIENLILEPQGRDTAPAVALAALTLKKHADKHGDNPVMGLFASDHRVQDVTSFHETLKRSIKLAEHTSGIVTLGIVPTFASTGYGYIERGEPLSDIAGAYKVARFVEKPNKVIAEQYFNSGNYYWNSGNFVCHVDAIVGELAKYAPKMLQALSRAVDRERVDEVFPSLQKISIDYTVMEKTQNAFVLAADFDWDDVGDWVALERLLRDDGDINTVVGKHIGFEASNNIIYTTDEQDVVVTLGIDNVVVVKRGNTVFVVAKDRVQEIKKLLEDDRMSALPLE
jgi:mannose-1-phosphate guanylyltransferase